MQQPEDTIQKPELGARRAFTLTELMIVISIMAILAGLGFSAFSGAIQLSRAQRSGSIINKIDQLIGERYEGYRTRAVPVKIPVGVPSRTAAMCRLNALRDLMRMELPDRIWDVTDPPCDACPSYVDAKTSSTFDPLISVPSPSLRNSYIRRAYRATNTTTLAALAGVWTQQNQGSECLYLILSTMRDGDKSALDYFDSTEVGDTDNDGMPEILDGWGTPIQFIRWPAGYAEQVGPDGAWGTISIDDDRNGTTDDIWEAGWPTSDDNLPIPQTLVGSVPTMQTKNYLKAPDPFDPVKIQTGTLAGFTGTYSLFPAYTPGYSLYPLIVSAGPNKSLDIVMDTTAGYHYSPPPASGPPPANNNYPNPYVLISVQLGTSSSMSSVPIGTPGDTDGDGQAGYTDNISNHSLRSQQ